MRRTRLFTVAAATAAVGAIALIGAGPASADPYGTVGVRETVCAQTLYLREAPLGAWQGTLTQGQTFLVEQIQGGWDYGFAYGNINRHGWVQAGWFC